MKLVHDFAVRHPDGADLDDVARRHVLVGRLEVERHVALQGVAEAPGVAQLQRLEEGEGEAHVTTVRRPEDDVVLRRNPPGCRGGDVAHAGTGEHPTQRDLHASLRLDENVALFGDRLLEAFREPDGLG